MHPELRAGAPKVQLLAFMVIITTLGGDSPEGASQVAFRAREQPAGLSGLEDF